MLGGIKAESIYIVCGYTDLRRSIDGLAHIVTSNYELDPFSKSMFLFCGRRRDRIKALLYEGDGFLLLYKRLDNGSFQWPRNKSEALNLSSEQFTWLMQGLAIEQPKAIKKRFQALRSILKKLSKPLILSEFHLKDRGFCGIIKA